ncbi:MAG: 3-dehydroquinate synthase [Myxococcaceae bacterium]
MRIPPGAYSPLNDRWGRFAALAPSLPERALVLADAKVLRLHPKVGKTLAAKGRILVALTAGEKAKSLRVLERVLTQALSLPRSASVVCVGGGTLGDLATVAAHVLKRGVSLIHVPSTLLAAVDSSVGGKGAVHLGEVKNALGVFHYAQEGWLCPELFETLSAKQQREGRIEAWKMVVTLDAARWAQYERSPPDLETLIRGARALKDSVCREDPYEQEGRRPLLNFGHTFGHVLESVTQFKLSHGDAVGVGIVCALDVGRLTGVTDAGLANETEALFRDLVGAPGRKALAAALKAVKASRLETLLGADKKSGEQGELRMILLKARGEAILKPVPHDVWRALLRAWQRGTAP